LFLPFFVPPRPSWVFCWKCTTTINIFLKNNPTQDCDFPEEEFIPGIRPESNYEEIDVMSFLHIKRAAPEQAAAAKKKDKM
jgi:hypothetical protein